MRALEASALIRLVHEGDGPALVRLGAQAFAEYDPEAARTMKQLMARTSARTFVAESRGAPVGFVVVEPARSRTFSVSAIAVGSAHRGRGVGEQLMRAAEHHALQAGARRLTLTTAQANVAALSLFFRLGFRIQKRVVRYFGGQPSCELAKTIL
jgi:ribosomal protein S18 acetylase RimI-like enzyme